MTKTAKSLESVIEEACVVLAIHVDKMIRREKGKWCVYSKDGNRRMGCYDTKGEAVERLRQVEGHSKKAGIFKGLPAEINDGGIHLHALERESRFTKNDGGHSHIFLVKSGVGLGSSEDIDDTFPEYLVLETDEDGHHSHSLMKSDDDSTDDGGMHYHTLYLPDGTIVETSKDGAHRHSGLQVATSSFDGAHVHELKLKDDVVVRSMTPGQIWKDLLMEPPQAHLPPLPPSSLFSKLSPEARGALQVAMSTHRSKLTQDAKARAAASDEMDLEKAFKEGKLPQFLLINLAKDAASASLCKKCASLFVPDTECSDLCTKCRSDVSKVKKTDAKSRAVRILKSEETKEERIIFGVVLVPNDVDAQGDIYDEEEVRKAAYSYMEVYGGNIKLMHRGEPLDDGTKVLETYLSKQEERHGNEVFPKGTWFMGARVGNDELWAEVKEGKWTGWSMGGTAVKEPLV